MNPITKTQEMILDCLRFVAESDELVGGFSARIGMDRGLVRNVMAHWPAIDNIEDQNVLSLAVNNALNEVCNAAYFDSERWNTWFTYSYRDMQSLLDVWVNSLDDCLLITMSSNEDSDFWDRVGSHPGSFYDQTTDEQRCKIDSAVILASKVSAMLGETYAPYRPGRLLIRYQSPIQQQTYNIRFGYLDNAEQILAHIDECRQCRHLYRTPIQSREVLEAMLTDWPPRHGRCS
ncbi:hypothetical protein CCAX7_27900 [Capsulimonas corticalis]|uniref:Uncharacterized protein n=1 Tax=Capsulimonas corticalis TaxID=2219043 RepID=A0A402CTG5_9BACT|nr:hypothetical protein [Capsulimonas corticalis]BDI30739.1 hypothetical protein CCAX7_27900 [Capsulimonas corticalis]